MDNGMNLADVPSLIPILETTFGGLDCVATAERTLEALKLTNCDFFTCYIKF
jgi:hypothetical protein